MKCQAPVENEQVWTKTVLLAPHVNSSEVWLGICPNPGFWFASLFHILCVGLLHM